MGELTSGMVYAGIGEQDSRRICAVWTMAVPEICADS